jgi:hypothetical protein
MLSRIATLAVLFTGAAAVGFVGPGRVGAAGVAVATAAFALLLARSPGPRRLVTAALFGALALFAAIQIPHPDPFSSPWMPDQLPFLIAYALATAAGLVARRAWGRWLALGGGLAGVVGFAWMAVRFRGVPSLDSPVLWRTVVLLAGSALVVVAMTGAAMRAHFGTSPRSLSAVPGVRGGVLRAGTLLALAAVPYLLMFAIEGRRPLPLVAALLVGAGAGLVIAGRTAGVLVTFAGAACTVAFAAGQPATWWWIGTLAPAVLGAALAMGAIVDPMWRRLRA